MATYIKIASVTAAGTVANIEFTSIPQTYTDLLLSFSLRTPNTTPTYDNLILWINGASSNESKRTLYGTGASALSNSDATLIFSEGGVVGSAATANTFSNGSIYIPNYASTTTNKSISIDAVAENNGTTAGMGLTAGLFSSTAAITALRLVPNYANYQIYSSATLYGIKNS